MIRSAQEFLELRFSDDPAKYQRAAHDEAPLAVWRELIESYPESRYWVAHNKTVPLEILRALALDGDVRVRGMVALRRKIDEPTQELLASDQDSGVRLSVARNKSATRRVLASMLTDEWDEIRNTARHRLDGVE